MAIGKVRKWEIFKLSLSYCKWIKHCNFEMYLLSLKVYDCLMVSDKLQLQKKCNFIIK